MSTSGKLSHLTAHPGAARWSLECKSLNSVVSAKPWPKDSVAKKPFCLTQMECHPMSVTSVDVFAVLRLDLSAISPLTDIILTEQSSSFMMDSNSSNNNNNIYVNRLFELVCHQSTKTLINQSINQSYLSYQSYQHVPNHWRHQRRKKSSLQCVNRAAVPTLLDSVD